MTSRTIYTEAVHKRDQVLYLFGTVKRDFKP